MDDVQYRVHVWRLLRYVSRCLFCFTFKLLLQTQWLIVWPLWGPAEKAVNTTKTFLSSKWISQTRKHLLTEKNRPKCTNHKSNERTMISRRTRHGELSRSRIALAMWLGAVDVTWCRALEGGGYLQNSVRLYKILYNGCMT